MLVLQLAYSGELDFVEELQELKELLKKKHIIIGVVESLEGKTHVIKVMCDDSNYSDRTGNIINYILVISFIKLLLQSTKKKNFLSIWQTHTFSWSKMKY